MRVEIAEREHHIDGSRVGTEIGESLFEMGLVASPGGGEAAVKAADIAGDLVEVGKPDFESGDAGVDVCGAEEAALRRKETVPDGMNAVLDWSKGPWFGSWTVRHISELEEQCGDTAGFPGLCTNDEEGTNILEQTTFNDLRFGRKIDWMKGFEIVGGVNNMFNTAPPACLSCSLNGYDASTYDAPGSRFYYLRVSAKF